MSNFFEKIRKKFVKEVPEGIPASTRAKTQPNQFIMQTAEASTAPLTEEELAEITQQSQQIEPEQLIVGVGRNVGGDVDADPVLPQRAIHFFLAAPGLGFHIEDVHLAEGAINGLHDTVGVARVRLGDVVIQGRGHGDRRQE